MEGQCCPGLAGAESVCTSSACPGKTGSPCGSDADCAEGNHCNGVGRGWCACDDDSEPGCFWPSCLNATDCEKYGPGSYCSSGFCGLDRLGSGVPCEDDSWCGSRTCEEGRCTGNEDVPIGGACEVHDWCAQDVSGDVRCCENAVGTLECLDATFSGTLGCPILAGGPCYSNGECSSGRCAIRFPGGSEPGICAADGWSCTNLYYGDAICHCGCGALDVDCVDPVVCEVCFCGPDGDEGFCSLVDEEDPSSCR